MLAKPSGCIGCPLEKIGLGFCKPEGLGRLKVAVVGEASGKNEAKDGLPFRKYAESGSLLERVFKVIKRERDDFRLFNVICCRPPGDILHGAKYEDPAVAHCRQYFKHRMDSFQPKATLAVGNVALKALTGVEGISQHRGYVWATEWGYVVAGFHPAYIRRGKSQLLPTLVYDLQKAIRIAYGQFTEFFGHPSYVLPPYNVHPSIDEARSFMHRVKDNQNLLLAYDIENPESAEAEETEREDLEFNELVQIQFSLGKREGIAFPWEEPYIGIAKEILSYENMKLGHNVWLYDNPVLDQLYQIRPKGVVHDTLAMFHHMHPDLEAGLQKAVSLLDFPFPWKHMAGSDLEWYGCADVDAPHWLWEGLKPAMEKRGIWDGYLRQVANFYPVLVNMQDRGVGLNAEYREEFKSTLEQKVQETDAELQAKIPVPLLNPHPAKGYKKVPTDVQEAIDRWEYHKALVEGQGKEMLTALEEYVYTKTGMVQRSFNVKHDELGMHERVGLECSGAVGGYISAVGVSTSEGGVLSHDEHGGIEGASDEGATEGAREGDSGEGSIQPALSITRWCKVKPFSARSSKQVIRYIQWAAKNDPKGVKKSKHVVPLTLREEKETTNKEELERLYFNTGDVVYKLVVEFREYSKILSNDIKQFVPSKRDGRVHTTFTMAPASGQLSSRSPNIQNVIKHTQTGGFRFKREIALGKAFRKMIVAEEGHVLMEFDKSAFHVVMMGRECQSESYIRAARADMHSLFASHVLARGGKPVKAIDPNMRDFEELKAQCAWVKKNYKAERDTKAKPTILGVALGLGYMKLWHTNRENIESPSEAKDLLAMLRDIFPDPFRWQNQVRMEAHTRNILVSLWGFCRTFYDVFQNKKDVRTGKWMLKPGTDSEKAIAFKVQNHAFGMMRQEMMRLEKKQANLRFGLVNTVHDSLVFEPKVKDIEYCYQVVTGVMNAPCKTLADSVVCPDGLFVGVDCKVGKNWAEMEDYKP